MIIDRLFLAVDTVCELSQATHKKKLSPNIYVIHQHALSRGRSERKLESLAILIGSRVVNESNNRLITTNRRHCSINLK